MKPHNPNRYGHRTVPPLNRDLVISHRIEPAIHRCIAYADGSSDRLVIIGSWTEKSSSLLITAESERRKLQGQKFMMIPGVRDYEDFIQKFKEHVMEIWGATEDDVLFRF